MFNQNEKRAIQKRITTVSHLSQKTNMNLIAANLHSDFIEICGMRDSPKRSERESRFQNALIDFESLLKEKGLK